MIRLSILALFCAFFLPHCKSTTNSAQVKAEEDIEGGPQWVASEGKWAIRCRDGRLHNGSKSALVSARDLSRACEENDPNYARPDHPGNPGGGHGRRELSLAECEGLNERVAKLTVALSPELQEEIRNLSPPSLARHRLCNGIAGQILNLVQDEDNYILFRDGGGAGVPIMILVGVAGTEVSFNKFDPSVTLPWQITNETATEILAKIHEQGPNILCGRGAVYYSDRCWYQGELGQNCKEACESKGMTYSSFTQSAIGGSSQKCRSLCTAFGFDGMNSAGYGGGLGCFVSNSYCHYSTSGGDYALGKSNSYSRLCTCERL